MRGCKRVRDSSLSMNPLALPLYLEALTDVSVPKKKPIHCSHASR